MTMARDGVTGRVKKPVRIRGGSGLGDSLYVRPVAEHFVRHGEYVQVCSDFPDVFLDAGCEVEPFGRKDITVLAHYTAGKQRADTTQWQDVCNSAGVPQLALRFDWQPRNQALLARIREQAAGRPIVLVHGGRQPMARTDGFGAELLPERRAFEAALFALEGCYAVRIGRGKELYPLPVNADLNGSTSVSDVLDLGWVCSAAVAQCSFMVPLCEAFDRPLLAVWAASGMDARRHPYIKSITPRKVLSKPTSRHVIDTWANDRISEEARAFRAIF